MRHEGSHRNSSGLLDMLLHVVPLQLSGVTKEDCELVEFDAVHKRSSGFCTGSLVSCLVHCNPRILRVHFLNNLVSLSTSFANKVDTKQLIGLHNFC